MSSLKIILITTFWFMLYGILNDQITIRICTEYFTVFHPRIVDSDDITVIAMAWGIVATWWFGLAVGVILALISRFLTDDKIDNIKHLLRLGGWLSVFVFSFSLVAGLIGYIVAANHLILVSYWFRGIPQAAETRFLAVLFWHNALYVAGGLSGVILAVDIWRRRNRVTMAVY
jgi:hypothetical protein